MTSSSSLAMRRYSIKPRTTKYAKGYEFLSFVKKLTIIGYNTRCFKNCFIKHVDLQRKKIADVVTKSNDDTIVKQEPVEEITTPLGKTDEILKDLRQVLS